MQGVAFELDDEMVVDNDERETLQDIINNIKLNEGFLTLARDIEVMEPKSPEDIYKVGTSLHDGTVTLLLNCFYHWDLDGFTSLIIFFSIDSIDSCGAWLSFYGSFC